MPEYGSVFQARDRALRGKINTDLKRPDGSAHSIVALAGARSCSQAFKLHKKPADGGRRNRWGDAGGF
jgi:hypothetical protein